MEFEDLLIWKLSEELTIEIYKEFTSCRDYAFRDQIQRAAISLMNNISEGYERRNDKEFRHFLRITKGSAGEIRSMLRVAPKLGYISLEKSELLIDKCKRLSMLTAGLIRKISQDQSLAG